MSTPEENPAPLLLAASAFAVGIICGTTLTFYEIGGTPLGAAEYVELEEVEGAILLFHSDDPRSTWDNTIARGVDLASGRYGYSHCALHCGLTDKDGDVLVAESFGQTGTRLHLLKNYGSRGVTVIPLDARDAAYARERALRLIERKTPYRGQTGGVTCSEFVVECLPPALRREKNLYGFVTPNQIAEAFGVPKRERNPAETRKLKQKLLR